MRIQLHKIFPENEHMKITMYATSLIAVWPFIFKGNPTLKKIYDIFSNCILLFYLVYTVTGVIKVFVVISNELMVLYELMALISATLLNSVTILRLITIKTHRMKKIIWGIVNLERKVLKSKDRRMIQIHKNYVLQNQVINKIFLFNVFLSITLNALHPLLVRGYNYIMNIQHFPTTNQTIVEKTSPLSDCFPLNENVRHICIYLAFVFDRCIGPLFVTCTDIFAFSLIIFPVGQLVILKMILTNFQEYVRKTKEQLNCDQEEASFITFRECMLEHKRTIKYIEIYNIAMKNIMMLDFLQSSVQLASVILVMAEMTINVVHVGQFALSMLLRLLVYYWYANEIMVHNSEIGTALYNSCWYDEPKKVKDLMIVMMLRCNRLLCLEIGPFRHMTLHTLIGILQASYSYMTVMYNKKT